MPTSVELDADDVRTAVSRLLGRDPGPVAWSAADVEHFQVHSTTAWLRRLSGTTSDGVMWSLVVKAMRLGEAETDALWTSSADESDRNYWKREYLAFSTGLLGSLPGTLRAPRCIWADEPAAGEARVWLEDIRGVSGRQWTDEHFAAAGRDLGTTQGAYLAQTPLPDAGWLSRGWLRSWVADIAAVWTEFGGDEVAWRDDRLAPLRVLRPAIHELAAHIDDLLDLLDRAPQTVIHGDFWPPNLFAAETGETVAVDWSSVGIGALAHDLDQLTLDPVWMQLRPASDLDALERAVVPAYAAGVRAAGADITDREVRRLYSAAAACHFGLNAGMAARTASRPDEVSVQERRWQRSFADIVASRAAVIGRVLQLGQGAIGTANGG